MRMSKPVLIEVGQLLHTCALPALTLVRACICGRKFYNSSQSYMLSKVGAVKVDTYNQL